MYRDTQCIGCSDGWLVLPGQVVRQNLEPVRQPVQSGVAGLPEDLPLTAARRDAVPTGQRCLIQRLHPAVELRDEEILAINADTGRRLSRVDDSLCQGAAFELECLRTQPQSGHRAETIYLD